MYFIQHCNGHLGTHLCNHSVLLKVTAPYAYFQNGKAKQYICTLEDGMQTLFQSPFFFLR
jgi:hypothetical protein